MSEPTGLNYYKTKVSLKSYEVTMTVDCAIFGYADGELKILLAKRAIEPFKDQWMLPGGTLQEDMTLEDTAHLVLKHLVDVSDVYISQIGTYSDVNRHPVKRVVTTGYYALVKPENHAIVARNYVSEVMWLPLSQVTELGFDHKRILDDALAILRERVEDYSIVNELLEEKFTLKELQDLHEIIGGKKLDRRNFRRKLENLNYVKATNEKKAGVQGGPSLYVFSDHALNNK
ncbi:MAG: NUDIX domain-containing protein [Bacteroidota bacterium]